MYLLYANCHWHVSLSLVACKLEFHLKSNFVFRIEKKFFARKKRAELNLQLEVRVKLKSSRDVKKPPRGSTFFDRYYLQKGSQTTNLIQEPNTRERFTSSTI
ncbi:hypothetical protein AAG906_025593 [Vitis piasezkii]